MLSRKISLSQGTCVMPTWASPWQQICSNRFEASTDRGSRPPPSCTTLFFVCTPYSCITIYPKALINQFSPGSEGKKILTSRWRAKEHSLNIYSKSKTWIKVWGKSWGRCYKECKHHYKGTSITLRNFHPWEIPSSLWLPECSFCVLYQCIIS